MKIALIGNQNCGKTTLFNQLTGSNQHVGNFPGVTIESKVGYIYKDKKLELVDLPGIYSLSPYSKEEVITRDFLIEENPDVILNIIDATNLERNLYLTLQLQETGIPLVVALNMMDELEKSHLSLNLAHLKEFLKVPIIPISALKKEGLKELVDQVKSVQKKLPICYYYDNSKLSSFIAESKNLIATDNKESKINDLFIITQVLEGNLDIADKYGISQDTIDKLNKLKSKIEQSYNLDCEAVVVDYRYQLIEKIINSCLKRETFETEEQRRSRKIDRFFTNRYLAFPILFLILGLVFYLSFGVIGNTLSTIFEQMIASFISFIDVTFFYDVNMILRSLIIDGVLNGIGSVLIFIPTILVLFLFLSLLEDSGYMARIAFIVDKPMRFFGLSGKSFVPLLLGFGCSVPAVMATRTFNSDRERRMTIFLVPFMSCSAKLPIYAVLTAAFFGNKAPFVMMFLYGLGIVVALMFSLIVKVLFKSVPPPFVLELPSYRFPSLKSTGMLMKERCKDFLKKAFSIIFLATIVVWFLQSFDLRLNYVTDSSVSLMAMMAKSISPFFQPLGFNQWEIISALITGLIAKETVLSTLQILLGSIDTIHQLLGPLEVMSLLVFILLYMPCVAAFAAIKRELHSTFDAILHMLLQTSIAWLCSFLFYVIGGLLI